jgi:hypothetical protein
MTNAGTNATTLGRVLGPDGVKRTMRFNPPTIIIFSLSFALAALAVLTKIGIVPIPRYLPHQEFWLAITAYFVLMLGCVFKGL